jgi:neutral ceramidase
MRTGHGKAEIKVGFKGIGMLGYGRDFNKIKGQLTPIYSRSSVFIDEEDSVCFIFVNCELCFTTQGVKNEVLKQLKERVGANRIKDERLMITSQHTHSAPGGFAHHPFYNFPVPGFRPAVFDAVVKSIVTSVVQAFESVSASKIYFHSGEFDAEHRIAFNRSIKAYNQNPEVIKRTKNEVHLAVDRRMDLLRIDGENDIPKSQINFFGVHTTSLGNRINMVSGDNKGYAANFFETEVGDSFQAVFAQQFAADVSPNFHHEKKKGPHDNDIENAISNGKIQFQKAKEIWEQAMHGSAVNGSIDAILMYVDFSDVAIDPDFANGIKNAKTDSACHGTAFFYGTPVDGPGMPLPVKYFADICSGVIKAGEYFLSYFRGIEYKNRIERKYKSQGKKNIIFESGRGIIYGSKDIKNFFIPGIMDGGIAEMKKQHKKGALRELPWTPHVLPIQIVSTGNLAWVGFPGEITTVGGQRLRNMLMEELKLKGIKNVIICSYANNYMGYCVTHEEYQVQCYEGGHTVFGEWTHAAFMTKFRELAREFCKPENERDIKNAIPHTFSEKEMSLRSYSV